MEMWRKIRQGRRKEDQQDDEEEFVDTGWRHLAKGRLSTQRKRVSRGPRIVGM